MTFRSRRLLVLCGSLALGCGDSGGPDQPSVSVSLAGLTRLHDIVAISASAQDGDGVAGVQFKVDGVQLGAEDTQAPFAVDWDTHQQTNGLHQVTADARDSGGNITSSDPVPVTVSNVVPLADRIILASDGPTGADFPDIYSVNADGSGLTRLTLTDGILEADPAVSPDGQQIAFTRRLVDGSFGDNFDVFVMNADGSGEVNLTNDPASDFRPAWSPDGSRIAFTSTRAGDAQIFVMNADGSAPAPVTAVAGGADEAAWSPDGSSLAFTHSNNVGQIGIAVVGQDGTGFKDLTPGGSDNGPAWSPDGAQLAFTRYDAVSLGHIQVMNADGSNLHAVFVAADTADSYPVWSRDGNQLIFERNVDITTNRDIWVINLDGGGAFRVLSLPGSEAAPDVVP